MLRGAPFRFLLFCDDLSFEKDDSHYKSLKAVLDGGIEGRPENVVLYATSNRRHLMPREMIENERQTGVNPSEATEEKVSLSDRFGLWLGFHACNQDDFLAMIRGYCDAFGLAIADEDLRAEAIEWSQTRGGRSGRVAWQYVTDLAGRRGVRLTAAESGRAGLARASQDVAGWARRGWSVLKEPPMPRAFLPLLVLLAGLAAPGAPARADMMSACAPEIQKFCSDVRSGRGRISACLASEMAQLGSACRPEVQSVMQSPLTPGYVRRAVNPSFRAPLPQACVVPAQSLCPNIPAGDARVFACLYARSDRAGKACSDAATATLRGR